MQNLVYKTFELNTDIEHFAKPINLSGATTIRLTYLPSGVECWISSESNGTNLYPLVNRGDGWVDLPEPLYNLYIYTKGTNVDNEKIILNYTGQRDFFQYGNSSTERIDKVGNLESVSNNVLYDLFKVRNNMFSTRNLVYMDFVNASYEIKSISTRRYLFYTNIADFSNINFADDKIYNILLEGHCDISSNAVNEELQGAVSWTSQSLHFNLIDMSTVNPADYTQQTNIDTTQISNLFLNNDAKNPFIETKDNHFTILGGKQTVDRYTGANESGTPMAWGSLPQSNFKISIFAPAFFFKKMRNFIACYKAGLNLNHNYGDYGFHFGIKIQIEEMESLPNDPIINTKPYINPRFLKQG